MTVVEGIAPTSSSLSEDAVFALEQAFLKLPFEQTRRCFRNELKVIDKEVVAISGFLASVDLEDGEKRARLLQRVQGVLSKLCQQREESAKYRRRTSLRLGKVESISRAVSTATESDAFEVAKWQQSRIFRLICEYLMQKGLVQSAFALVDQQGLQEYVDVELYEESLKIRSLLMEGKASECLLWCSENRALLKKSNCPLEFMLRRQEFIELSRSRDLHGAMAYARKHFPAFGETNAAEIEQCLALLAIQPTCTTFPYDWLYDQERWSDLANQFDVYNRELYGLPERPQLISLIHAGLAALKTPQCASGENACLPNVNCPVCMPPLSAVARRLPFAHHETSLLVCSISGAVMDEDNAPMCLPNGNVYSMRVLEQMASTMGGNVVCPRTKQAFRLVEARKCYIS